MSIHSGIGQALVRIESAQDRTGRPDPVELKLAVKTRTPEECYKATHVLTELGRPILLGHNRVQEARSTVTAIRQIEGAELRLIGPLQSNRIDHALGCVDVIESVDCPILVKKIDARVNQEVPIFLEMNVPGEEIEHGCHPNEADALVGTALGTRHLRLCGLMTVGLNSPTEKDVRAAYAQLHPICERTEAVTELRSFEPSMGMSADLEWAIAEGAGIARVDAAVFGERRPHN